MSYFSRSAILSDPTHRSERMVDKLAQDRTGRESYPYPRCPNKAVSLSPLRMCQQANYNHGRLLAS